MQEGERTYKKAPERQGDDREKNKRRRKPLKPSSFAVSEATFVLIVVLYS